MEKPKLVEGEKVPRKLTLEQKRKKREREKQRYKDKKLAAREPRRMLPPLPVAAGKARVKAVREVQKPEHDGQVVDVEVISESKLPLRPKSERELCVEEAVKSKPTALIAEITPATAPEMITKAFCRAVEGLLATGMSVREMCGYLGITLFDVWHMTKVAPWFKESVTAGVDNALVLAAHEGLYKRSTGCSVRKIVKEVDPHTGELVVAREMIEELPPDVRAHNLVLANRDAQRWGRNTEGGTTVIINSPEIERPQVAGTYQPSEVAEDE